MPAYVRVRKHPDLVAAIQRRGTQTDIAALAGISLSRLSQLYTGRHDVIEINKAAALEDVLGVDRGSLFRFSENYERLAPYVHGNPPDGPEPDPDESDDTPDEDIEQDEPAEREWAPGDSPVLPAIKSAA